MNNNKLRIKMLMLTVLPLSFLALILITVSFGRIKAALINQTKEEIERQCTLVEQMYDKLYPGDYAIKVIDDTSYTLTKGTYDITYEDDTLDNLKEAYSDEFTIFADGISVMTTLRDDKNKRIVLNEISSVIKSDVIDNKEPKFYSDVTIDGKSYYAYFRPIINENGTCFGMYGVYKEVKELSGNIYRTLLPISIVYIIATIIIGMISVMYSKRIVARIHGIQKFMNALSNGSFTEDMPAICMKADDELAELARIGKSMQNSVRMQVECDELTKLNNRKFAIKAIEKVLEKANKNGIDFCVAIGDIDFFKKVNDTYGHDCGDEVLVRVSQILKKNMVGKGFVARWGGEEFLFIFDMLKLDESRDILENILSEVRAMDIQYGNDNIHVTMSFGLSKGNINPDMSVNIVIDNNIKSADEKLYYAKEHGRNQIVM